MNWMICIVTVLLFAVLSWMTALACHHISSGNTHLKHLVKLRDVTIYLLLAFSWLGLNKPTGIPWMFYFWNNYDYWSLTYHIISSLQHVLALFLLWPLVNDLTYYLVRNTLIQHENPKVSYLDYVTAGEFMSGATLGRALFYTTISIILFVL